MSKTDLKTQKPLMAGAGGSYQRVNLVTEAQSVLPSLTSAFSIESMVERQPYYMSPRSEVLRRRVLPSGDLGDYRGDVTSSCHDLPDPVTGGLDPFDNPTYTDTVKSTDSTGSALRRSISVPPEYTFKHSTGGGNSNQRRHAREVFEEYFKMLDNDNQNSNPDIERALEASEEAIASNQDGKKWRQTMADLLENPEYVDSIESTSSGAVLLAKSAASLGRQGGEIVSSALVPRRIPEEGEHLKYVKNLIILSLSFNFIFCSYISVRNLQSSIIEDSSLAFMALSSVYASLFVGCFFGTSIVQRVRPKRTMILCMFSYMFYIAANFYPHYYTMVPASSLVGFCMGIMWTAQATYLTNISACYAEITGKVLRNVVSKFNGIFFGIFGISQIVGGIITATVLMNQNTVTDVYYTFPSTHNVSTQSDDSMYLGGETPDNMYMDPYTAPSGVDDVVSNASLKLLCGAEYCAAHQAAISSSPVDTKLLYTLLGIYGGLLVVGIFITLCFLDPLEGVMAKSHDTFCAQMTAVFKWFADYRVVCLGPIAVYSLISMSFMFGEFNKAFVTCPLGVHMVGYASICMSAANSISSYVNGRLQKYVGQLVLFLLVGVIDLSLLVAMLLWRPSLDTLPVLFVIVGFWGVAEAILMTQLISLFAVTFKDNKEPAFSGLKMFQALGACLNFATAKYMCARTKIYIVGGLLVCAMFGIIMLEVLTRKREKKECERREAQERVTANTHTDDYGTTHNGAVTSSAQNGAITSHTQNGAVTNVVVKGATESEKKVPGPTPV